MTDLVTRAEIVKMARTLGATTEIVAFLEPLGAEDLRELRERIGGTLFDEHSGKFHRLAEASRIGPVALVAKIAERAIGPVLAARVASLVNPKRAAHMAEKLSVPFMADTAVGLDPRRVQEIIARVPTRTVVSVGHELLRRGDHITMAQFADSVGDEVIRAVEESVPDDEALMRVGFYLESPETIDKLVGLLPGERLDRFVQLAVTGPVELRIAGLSLMGRVGGTLRTRLADLAIGKQPEAELAAFAESALDEGAVGELLTVVTHASPGLQAKMDRVVERLPEQRLRQFVHAGVTGPVSTRVAALMLIHEVNDALKTRLADLAAEESEAVLGDFLDTAIRNEMIAEMLATVAHMSPPALDKSVRLPVLNDPAVLEALIRAAVDHGLWTELLPVVDRMDQKSRQHGIDLIQGLDPRILAGLAREATEQQMWPPLLRLLAEQEAPLQERIAAAWKDLGGPERAVVEEQIHALGLEAALSPLRTALAGDRPV